MFPQGKREQNFWRGAEVRRISALRPAFTMAQYSSSSSSSVGLLFLLVVYAAAGPQPALQPQAVRSSACQEHTSLHSRLDAVEKNVEDAVENLESELAALLQAVQDPEWRPLLASAGRTTVDILEDPEGRRRS
ncbi:placenta-specific protein 9-like [Nelusetta ayraudi]|uniref:placenta-specific protein 9-like n=1 Tax=Nelusetta ayraudi TaxID=303726 RepID=UPI003F728ECC